MTDYKTMRVPESDWQHAKEQKQDGETWGDYLRRCGGSKTSTDGGSVEQLDEITELLKDMDVVSRNQNVIGRIDDLEATLIKKFETELRK